MTRSKGKMEQPATGKLCKIKKVSRWVGCAGTMPALALFCVAVGTGTSADRQARNQLEETYEIVDANNFRYWIRAPTGSTVVEVLQHFKKSAHEKPATSLAEPIKFFQTRDREVMGEEASDHFLLAGLSMLFAMIWWVLTQGLGRLIAGFIENTLFSSWPRRRPSTAKGHNGGV